MLFFIPTVLMLSQVLSLSIDETNKLRAKLGLKPLNVNKADVEETAEEKKQPGVLIPGDRFVCIFTWLRMTQLENVRCKDQHSGYVV